jgi:hypothetical protein
VVLGTIQVLRTNALGTGRSIIQAVVGNAIGVVIGGLFAVVAGNPALMWSRFQPRSSAPPTPQRRSVSC